MYKIFLDIFESVIANMHGTYGVIYNLRLERQLLFSTTVVGVLANGDVGTTFRLLSWAVWLFISVYRSTVMIEPHMFCIFCLLMEYYSKLYICHWLNTLNMHGPHGSVLLVCCILNLILLSWRCTLSSVRTLLFFNPGDHDLCLFLLIGTMSYLSLIN
jgi:hypothetical protein